MAFIVRRGALGVEHSLLFPGHVLCEVMLLLHREQVDIMTRTDRHTAVLALDTGCAQSRIVVRVQGNPAARLEIGAMHRFIAGLGGLFKALARCKGMAGISCSQGGGIEVMPSRHADALAGLQLRSGEVDIVPGLQLKIAARLQGLCIDALRSRGRRDLRLALLRAVGCGVHRTQGGGDVQIMARRGREITARSHLAVLDGDIMSRIVQRTQRSMN